MDVSTKYQLTGAVFWVLISWVLLPLVLVFGVLPLKTIETTHAHWVFEWDDAQGWVAQAVTKNSQIKKTTLTPKQGYWVVQVATFQSAKRAGLLQTELKEKGFQSTVFEVPKQAKILFAVRVGPVSEKRNAERTLQALQREMGLMPILMFISTQ